MRSCSHSKWSALITKHRYSLIWTFSIYSLLRYINFSVTWICSRFFRMYRRTLVKEIIKQTVCNIFEKYIWIMDRNFRGFLLISPPLSLSFIASSSSLRVTFLVLSRESGKSIIANERTAINNSSLMAMERRHAHISPTITRHASGKALLLLNERAHSRIGDARISDEC